MIVAELREEVTTMAGEKIVIVRHKGEYYNVAFIEECIGGNLVLVIRDTPDAEEEIDPDSDDDQSQKEEDTSDDDHPENEDSGDTNLEEILEELEGSSSPGIYSSHARNSVITRDQAAKYRISQREAA
jgi:hypothetical protein